MTGGSSPPSSAIFRGNSSIGRVSPLQGEGRRFDTYFPHHVFNDNMILISKFKDYYDFMVGITGIDKKVIFQRGEIKFDGELKIDFVFPHGYYYPSTGRIEPTYHILSICGKRYTLIESKDKQVKSEWKNFRLVSIDDLKNKDIFNQLCPWGERKKMTSEKLLKRLHGVESKSLIEISKKIRSPVFLISGVGYKVVINNKSPILKEIKGISKLIDPKTLFLDISFFISNVLTEPRPMIKVSDKVKIEKAGFDVKKSFRRMI